MNFEEILNKKLNHSDILWRYMSIHKFIHLLRRQSLIFTRLDQFQDPFEGITFQLIADRFIAKRGPTKENINPSIPKEQQDKYIRENELRLERFEVESLKQQKTQFVNCWIQSNRESMAMWRTYSNRESVAVKIDGKTFIEYLKSHLELQPFLLPRLRFICGRVEYLKLNPIENLLDQKNLPSYSAFKKDSAFDFEREYRLLIVSPLTYKPPNPKFIELELSKTFFDLVKVVCHPEMEDWEFENIQSLCNKYEIKAPERSLIELK